MLSLYRAGPALAGPVLATSARHSLFPTTPYDVHGGLAAAVFLITTFAHDAVIIFFILSGYLVGGAVREDRCEGSKRAVRVFAHPSTRRNDKRFDPAPDRDRRALLVEFVLLSALCIVVASVFSALFERPRRAFKRFLRARLPLSWSPEPNQTRQ